MYQQLVEALKATNIPFAEYEWSARPKGSYGVVSLDRGAAQMNGDDKRVCQAMEGDVELYLLGGDDADKRAAVEQALTSICGGAWRLDDVQFEMTPRLLHYSYVFQLEMM